MNTYAWFAVVWLVLSAVIRVTEVGRVEVTTPREAALNIVGIAILIFLVVKAASK